MRSTVPRHKHTHALPQRRMFITLLAILLATCMSCAQPGTTATLSNSMCITRKSACQKGSEAISHSCAGDKDLKGTNKIDNFAWVHALD